MTDRPRRSPWLPLALWTLGLFGAPAVAEEPAPAEPPVAPAEGAAPRGWQIAPEFGRPEIFRAGSFSRAADECRPAFDLWIRGGWAWCATGTIDTAGVTIRVNRFDPVEKQWQAPADEPRFAGFDAADPFITTDGSRLYFAGRPRRGAGRGQGFDIWETHRNGSGWSEPVRLPAAVNGPANEASPWETANGTLYFTSDRPGGRGDRDVYRCRRVDGVYQPAENVAAVNTPSRELDLCVDAGERWLVVSSDRPGGQGGLDLWAAVADSTGGWGAPRDVDPPLNSPADDFAPVIWAPPGDAGYPGWVRYFFFSSTRVRDLALLRNSGRYHGRGETGEEPGLGRADIYQASLVALGVPNESVW